MQTLSSSGEAEHGKTEAGKEEKEAEVARPVQ
jgi:hypothetical protein